MGRPRACPGPPATCYPVRTMTDRTDIVARLREYTRHNKPVLSTDLKEAADHIEDMRRKVEYLLVVERGANESAQAQALSLARRVSEQAGHQFDPHENISHVWTAVGDVRRERDALHRRLCDIADATAYRGVPLVGPDLVEHVRKVARDRDALLPKDIDDNFASPFVNHDAAPAIAAEGHRPGFVPPPALSWDDVDRRIAELESRVRLTQRRLELAAMTLSASDGDARCTSSRLISSLTCDDEGLTRLAKVIRMEARRRG